MRIGNGLEQLPDGLSAAELNARRASGARLVKAYNTLTAGFLAQAAGRTKSERVVVPYAGEDAAAKQVVAHLIADSGFEPFGFAVPYGGITVGAVSPFDVGGWRTVPYIEPPRRSGAFYGEEWHLDTACVLLDHILSQGKRDSTGTLDY